MSAARSAPKVTGFVLGLVLCGVLAGAGLVLVFTSGGAHSKAEKRLAAKQRELAALLRVEPVPSPAQSDRSTARRNAAVAVQEELRAQVQGSDALGERLRNPEPPRTRADMFFELSALLSRLRQACAGAGVTTSPEPTFGFSAYLNSGPAEEDIPMVYRQAQAVEHLVGLLCAVQPIALQKIERNEPNVGGNRLGGGSAARGPEIFVLEPTATVARPGILGSVAIRITFTGRTPHLRELLNRLADGQAPTVVRRVEVAMLPPAPIPASSDPGQPGSEVKLSPVVAGAPRVFTLTVEYVWPEMTDDAGGQP